MIGRHKKGVPGVVDRVSASASAAAAASDRRPVDAAMKTFTDVEATAVWRRSARIAELQTARANVSAGTVTRLKTVVE